MTVYKDYSQEQLNNQYNTRLHVPDYGEYFKRWERLSRQAERNHKNVKDISFGKFPEECLDIYPSENPGAKTLIFIHGGYWHLLDKALFHFLAPAFLELNINVVFINYRLAPTASMDRVVSSCRRAVYWLHDHIMRYNGDPSQLYVLGHSAGGHLASMLLVDEKSIFLKGAVALSGLFRLKPIMLTSINEVLGMDDETAGRNSPVFLKPINHCPLLLVTGADETHEFIDQGIDLYDCWKSVNSDIKLLHIKGKNHYSIVEAIIEKDSILASAIMDLMKIEQQEVKRIIIRKV